MLEDGDELRRATRAYLCEQMEDQSSCQVARLSRSEVEIEDNEETLTIRINRSIA